MYLVYVCIWYDMLVLYSSARGTVKENKYHGKKITVNIHWEIDKAWC